MCPCEPWRHYVCGICRRRIANDLIRLRRAEVDGRGYDAEIRALRGRLTIFDWRRELVERDLDFGGPEYARTGAAATS